MIAKVKGETPKVNSTAFVHKTAVVTGDVILDEGVSIWPCAVLRGDVGQPILIGKNTNIQDNSVLHTNAEEPLIIEKDVVIGHNVNLHSCVIGEGSLVGIGAIVLDGAKIGKNSVVAAGTLVPPGKEFPERSMLMGSPAKVMRQVSQEEIDYQKMIIGHYEIEAEQYLETEEEIMK